MATTERRDKTAAERFATEHDHLDRRTVRAAVEAMAIDAYTFGEGSGLFDVYSSSGDRYTVDLRASAAGERACTCADAEHNLSASERCKHERRVRFMLGIDPVPVVLLGVRDATLSANMRKFGAEPSVEAKAAQAVRADAADAQAAVATDGGAR